MEDGLFLPWWGFSTDDFISHDPVVIHEAPAGEAMIAAFLWAGARSETAEAFIAANSLHVAGILDALGRDEIVRSSQVLVGERPSPHEESVEAKSLELPSLVCRSRLFGMPLADRHSAISVACCLTHRLPRRALANFLCRLVFGTDVAHFKEDRKKQFFLGNGRPQSSNLDGTRYCPCGRKALLETEDGKLERGKMETSRTLARRANETGAVCRACLGRRAWVDSVSARLLMVACRKLRWGRTMPEDENTALERCLAVLSEIVSSRASKQFTVSSEPAEPSAAAVAVAGDANRARDGESSRSAHLEEGRTKGTSALLARVRSQRSRSGERQLSINPEPFKAQVGSDQRSSNVSRFSWERKRRRAEEETPQPAAKTKKALMDTVSSLSPRGTGSTSTRAEILLPDGITAVPVGESALDSARARVEVEETSGGGKSNAIVGRPSADSSGATQAVVGMAGGKHQDPEAVSKEEGGGKHHLSDEIRERISSVAERVAAAGARGVTSVDVQGAAAEAVCLLQAAVMPNALAAQASSSRRHRPQPHQTLEIVCKDLGLHASGGKQGPGCGDDLVMAVCKGFVTPTLSLKNCLAFVKAVLVPRARSLKSPASRLLVTAVSGIGGARPEALIDGLIIPLLCEGEPSKVGSAQCELCTRLIKQVLPKHTLDAMLVGLCQPRSKRDVEGGSSGREAKGGECDHDQNGKCCPLTELTMPVITAAVNAKPPLSDNTIGVVVRRLEAASEEKQMQKSLKFTTLLHGLVTRYGPQLKPFLSELRAAIGRCSTFMVKTVLAALQRLEK